MSLHRIRLELARNAEFPEGSNTRGYEFMAPLTADGSLDAEAWKAVRDACRVHRFWQDEDHEYGKLVHHRGHRWAFQYDGTDDEDEEPIFRFDRHRFAPGEYVSITEHDEVQRTFLVTEVVPAY
jgi:hypothetical protein